MTNYLHPSAQMTTRRVELNNLRRCRLCGGALTPLGVHADSERFDCGFDDAA